MFRPISPIISAETTLPLESSYYAWGDYRYVVICKRRLHVAWNTKVVGSSFKQYCLCHAFDRRRYGYQGKMISLKYLHPSIIYFPIYMIHLSCLCSEQPHGSRAIQRTKNLVIVLIVLWIITRLEPITASRLKPFLPFWMLTLTDLLCVLFVAFKRFCSLY